MSAAFQRADEYAEDTEALEKPSCLKAIRSKWALFVLVNINVKLWSLWSAGPTTSLQRPCLLIWCNVQSRRFYTFRSWCLWSFCVHTCCPERPMTATTTYMCIHALVCMNTYIHIYICTCIYIYMCICICICIRNRKSEHLMQSTHGYRQWVLIRYSFVGLGYLSCVSPGAVQ